MNTKCADCRSHVGFNALKVSGRLVCNSCRLKSFTYSNDTNDKNSKFDEYVELGYQEPEVNEEVLTSFQKLQFVKFISNETGMNIEKSEEFLKSINETEKSELINTFFEQNNLPNKQVKSKSEGLNSTEKLGDRKDITLPICPKCESQAVSVNTQKFGVGKAFTGAILTGGVGLLAGGIGRNNIKLTCLSCGNKWKP